MITKKGNWIEEGYTIMPIRQKKFLGYKNWNKIYLETWDMVSSVAFDCSALVFLVGYIILASIRLHTFGLNLDSGTGLFKH